MKTFLVLAMLSAIICTAFSEFANLPLNGAYQWDLLLNVDNLGQDVTIKRKYTLQKTLTTNYEEFRKEVTHAAATITAGASVNILSSQVLGQVDTTIETTYENLIEIRESETRITIIEDEVEVGPYSTCTLYRLIYVCPGVYYETDTISSHPYDLEHFDVEIQIEW